MACPDENTLRTSHLDPGPDANGQRKRRRCLLVDTSGFKFDLVYMTRQAITNEFADDYADLLLRLNRR